MSLNRQRVIVVKTGPAGGSTAYWLGMQAACLLILTVMVVEYMIQKLVRRR